MGRRTFLGRRTCLWRFSHSEMGGTRGTQCNSSVGYHFSHHQFTWASSVREHRVGGIGISHLLGALLFASHYLYLSGGLGRLDSCSATGFTSSQENACIFYRRALYSGPLAHKMGGASWVPLGAPLLSPPTSMEEGRKRLTAFLPLGREEGGGGVSPVLGGLWEASLWREINLSWEEGGTSPPPLRFPTPFWKYSAGWALWAQGWARAHLWVGGWGMEAMMGGSRWEGLQDSQEGLCLELWKEPASAPTAAMMQWEGCISLNFSSGGGGGGGGRKEGMPLPVGAGRRFPSSLWVEALGPLLEGGPEGRHSVSLGGSLVTVQILSWAYLSAGALSENFIHLGLSRCDHLSESLIHMGIC